MTRVCSTCGTPTTFYVVVLHPRKTITRLGTVFEQEEPEHTYYCDEHRGTL